MRAISMTELNAKSPFSWELDNLVMLNTRAGEVPKTLQFVDSDIDGIEGFEVGSFSSSGGRSDGGTGSDLGYAFSSRSSKSASFDSSTDREIKETTFSLGNDCSQQDLGRKRDIAMSGQPSTSPTVESSAASGESLAALELSNRTYFEDVSGVSNVTNAAQAFPPPNSCAKKSKTTSVNLDIPRCQVEGCNTDLSLAKEYHRKHRVCEGHAKSTKVIINGWERRFCQQCSRFHGLLEFDQKKRSCRRRLSDHNARRRKPKPEVIQFNSMRLTSSLYEGTNQLNFGFNKMPELHTTGHGTWDNTRNATITLAKPGSFSTIKSEGNSGLQFAHAGLQSSATKISPASPHFLPSKGAPSEVYQQGFPVSVATSNMDTAQDLRALSLLSTSSWGSCNQQPSLLGHTTHANNSFTQPMSAVHIVPLGGPADSSNYWQTEQTASSGPGSYTSSFQLFKAPNESSFYLY